LYRPVAGHIRDYHNFSWDVGDDSSNTTKFPRIYDEWMNWDTVYGDWVDEGYQINPAIQFSNYGTGQWTNAAADANKYGRAFATAFGPAVGSGVVHSVQIGNEPGNMSDALYESVFENMAAAVRAVDPSLPIVTSNVRVGASGQYHKSLSLFEDKTHLFDVISINTYPQLRGSPTWERSYPEDPRLTWLTEVQSVIDWRDQHAPGKQIWITEFGYDASTKQPDPNSQWKDWKDVTDAQQAQYLTRSFLAFARMDLDRAYMYWYNDNDTPSLHAASGLTRNGAPKPAYWAMKHQQETLGDFRFDKVVRADADQDRVHVYQFEDADDPTQLIWAIWLATGAGLERQITLSDLAGDPLWAERMPMAAGAAEQVGYTLVGDDEIQLTVGETPVYLRLAVVPEPASAVLVLAGVGAVTLRRGRRSGVVGACGKGA
jgi:serine/threonine-protein kinase ATR